MEENLKKIKVLMVLNDLKLTGIAKVVMNYINHIDLNKYDIEIACGLPIVESWLVELDKRNIKINRLPHRKNSTFKFYSSLFKVIKKGKYDIVEAQGNSATMALELLIAKLAGVKKRIAHCHNSKSQNMSRHKMFMPLFKMVFTHGFACSSLAGEWIFGENNFTVINNGFNTEKFMFDETKRNEYRKVLGLNDKFVLGHVGRFNEVKNHEFLIKVYEQYFKVNNNSALLF